MTRRRAAQAVGERLSRGTVRARALAGAVAMACAVLPQLGSPPAAGATLGSAAALTPAALTPATAADVSSTTQPTDSEPVPTGGVIVRFRTGSEPAVSSAARDRALGAVARRTDSELDAVTRLGTGATLVGGATPEQARQVADTLAARADVAYAEPDVRLRVSAAPDDPYYADYQWDLSSATYGINVRPAWARSQGAGVTVAVVDTGIVAHPDLAGRVLPGHDFISDARTARDGGGRDADPADAGDWLVDGDCDGTEQATASTWHGTHVAGTIAAVAGNGVGVAGVAPKASILPVRAIGRCGGSLSDIADAITWASGGRVTGVAANSRPARIVNLSLGAEMSCPATMQAAIDGAIARGSLVVTASGNSGVSAYREAPGNCKGVVNVGATNRGGARAAYSNHGAKVTLSAPGGQSRHDAILSTVDRGTRRPTGPGYAFMVGTSMASPHVSGVAALLASADPTLTPGRLRRMLVGTARPFPGACSGCGAGIVDAGRAVAALRSPAVGDAPTAAPDPTSGPTPAPPPGSTTAAPVPNRTPVPDRLSTGRAHLAWAPFQGAQGVVRYTVQWRPITVVRGARSYGSWTTLASGTTARWMWSRGTPGAVYQFRVRGVDAAGVTSAWSSPSAVSVPIDLTRRAATWSRGWGDVRDTSAVSSTLMRTRTRGATMTLPATHASGAAVVAATAPAGGTFDVYIDGRRVRRVSTTARTTAAARAVATVRVPYGRHTVKIVAVGGTVTLDAVAYLR